MPFFTKKPVTIEARRFDGTTDSAADLAHWVNSSGGKAYAGGLLVIETLEGDHRAGPGDFIIKGVAGEFYPCKPDIFEASYSPV